MTLLLALVALATAADAPAEEGQERGSSTSFTDDFEVRYWVIDRRLPDPDDVPVFNYFEQVNRLTGSVSSGDLTLEAQVDEVALFASQYWIKNPGGQERLVEEREFLADDMLAPFTVQGADGTGDGWSSMNRYGYATLEKVRARVEKDHYTLVFGDAYAAFGRGIALNLNRNVDIDIDTSIQGFKGVFRPGAWDITVVAGQLNRQQVYQDNPNLSLTGDRRHGVAGVRVDRYGLGPANAGAHVVAYDFVGDNGWSASVDPKEGAQTLDAVVGGGTLELMGVGGVDWFAEGDVFGYPTGSELPNQVDTENGERFFEYGTAARPNDLGYATYLSAGFYPGKTTWLVELKRFYQTERINSLLPSEFYEVATAPTLEYERATNEDSSAAVNSDDIVGGRVKIDYTAKRGLVPYISAGVYRDMDLGVLHFNQTPETILHPVVGVEYIHDESSVLMNAGYRYEIRDQLDGAVCQGASRRDNLFLCEPGADSQVWADASIRFPFVAGLHGEYQADLEVYQWGVNEFQQSDFVEVTSGITLQKGSDVAVTLYNDFSTNPLVTSSGNLPLEVGTGEEAQRPLYGAVEVQVKPTSALTMKAFAGAYKAGIRCSGGQCRQLPGFEGARFSVQGAF